MARTFSRPASHSHAHTARASQADCDAARLKVATWTGEESKTREWCLQYMDTCWHCDEERGLRFYSYNMRPSVLARSKLIPTLLPASSAAVVSPVLPPFPPSVARAWTVTVTPVVRPIRPVASRVRPGLVWRIGVALAPWCRATIVVVASERARRSTVAVVPLESRRRRRPVRLVAAFAVVRTGRRSAVPVEAVPARGAPVVGVAVERAAWRPLIALAPVPRCR